MREKYFLIWSLFIKSLIHSIQRCYVPSWPSGPGEGFKILSMNFSLFRYYPGQSPLSSPLTNLIPHHPRMLCVNKLESPLPKDALCKVWLKLTYRYGKENFSISLMYFHFFLTISPLKSMKSFILTNLNQHHLKMLCAKID